MCAPYICTVPGWPLTASRCPNDIFNIRIEILTLINKYLVILGGLQYLTLDTISGRPDPYLDSLHQPPDHLQAASKTEYYYQYLNWTLLQLKFDKLKYTKTILLICLKIWSWTSWSRIIQVVQLNFWHEIWNPEPKKPKFTHTWRHLMFVIRVYTWMAWSIPGKHPAASRSALGCLQKTEFCFRYINLTLIIINNNN